MHLKNRYFRKNTREMNIALIGYGRMGREIESVAKERGHVVPLVIDVDNQSDLTPSCLKDIDVVIEFSSPDSAFENIHKCLEMRIPVVSGTTGWQNKYDLAAESCIKNGTSFIHSSNFSVGVNIFFRLNKELARIMDKHRDYTPFIEEIHHIKKLDAPSGTAISLANGISESHDGYDGWCSGENIKENCIPMKSVREGSVPGTHIVSWTSGIDSISLKHEAMSRRGFAYGAVLAAEYIRSRKGLFTMNDVLGF